MPCDERSGYRQGKFNNSVQDKCSFCGSHAHSNSTRDVREWECKAYSVKCNSCKKLGHFSEVCLAKKKNQQTKVKVDELQTDQKGGLNLDRLIVVPNINEEEVSVQAVSTDTELPVESAAPFTPPPSSRSVG